MPVSAATVCSDHAQLASDDENIVDIDLAGSLEHEIQPVVALVRSSDVTGAKKRSSGERKAGVATQQQKSAEDDVENEEELPTDDAVTESQLEADKENEKKSDRCEVRNQSLMTLNTVVTANQTETTAVSEPNSVPVSTATMCSDHEQLASDDENIVDIDLAGSLEHEIQPVGALERSSDVTGAKKRSSGERKAGVATQQQKSAEDDVGTNSESEQIRSTAANKVRAVVHSVADYESKVTRNRPNFPVFGDDEKAQSELFISTRATYRAGNRVEPPSCSLGVCETPEPLVDSVFSASAEIDCAEGLESVERLVVAAYDICLAGEANHADEGSDSGLSDERDSAITGNPHVHAADTWGCMIELMPVSEIDFLSESEECSDAFYDHDSTQSNKDLQAMNESVAAVLGEDSQLKAVEVALLSVGNESSDIPLADDQLTVVNAYFISMDIESPDILQAVEPSDIPQADDRLTVINAQFNSMDIETPDIPQADHQLSDIDAKFNKDLKHLDGRTTLSDGMDVEVMVFDVEVVENGSVCITETKKGHITESEILQVFFSFVSAEFCIVLSGAYQKCKMLKMAHNTLMT
jgi:hypothetical protein